MNAHTILTKIISLVSFKMHLTRQKKLVACVKSLTSGSAASVTSMGRGIRSHAFEKHRIKRADRLLSNGNLQRETPHVYAAICYLFCRSRHPVSAEITWTGMGLSFGKQALPMGVHIINIITHTVSSVSQIKTSFKTFV